MITLKTLAQATEQQVFDQVAKHLLTQNKRSINNRNCFYRLESLKCAAGCLIADDEYNSEFEGKDWSILIMSQLVPQNHYELIARLQSIHDNHIVEEWKGKLELLAKEYKLNFNF